ncbi:Eukaryotic translation initiation factor 5 [Wickerhamomyces ciferrii]|uniref:Eukaryotic translation initiation factor 5 n=1 Tax=Wickerhamomyces ciferrii (strain ATCC 14091 / BCRC 22168 / CBS 111 / JCM 3599 / NBRC 0793 / NRRL Y-1031 F-60-10) TaxID=1206466 RepID=K0KKA9_WICCF|nr:Eukaryotic translation initiation factor 5 [Wickerhamomyces ciferrii]CCH42602.1 Eukaryotic translation initiation factor 5 [Wickerhamomyces ciferrii]
MPPIQAKVEGRGNGIKTAIPNLSEVARALGRPPSYLIKYFGFELGAQTSINESTDRYLVNGVHDQPKLQDSLDGFINKFVLCGSCKNPETVIIITKDGNLIRDCKACGQRTSIDPRSKLATYIEKNPPESAKGSGKKKKSATASANVVGGGMSISDIASGNKKTTEPKEDEGENSDDDALTRKINAEASALPTAQPIDDDDWAVDVSEEAVRKRALELEALNLENGGDSAFDQFGEWLLEFGEDKDELPNDVEIYKKALELEIHEDVNTVQVLAQTLFDEEIVQQIAQHKGLLTKIITTPKHEKAFLGGLERFLGKDKPELLSQISKILLQVYENDIVDEETIKDWGSKVSKKYVSKEISKKVKKAAKPFIEWLNQADEESSDEESD